MHEQPEETEDTPMKKSIFCPILASCLIVAVLSGCSANSDAFTPQTYSTDSRQISAIDIEVRDRPVYLTSTDGHEIVLAYAESAKERYDIAEADGTLRVTLAEGTKSWPDYVGVKPAEEDRILRIEVPHNALHTLRIQTTNAPVQLDPVTVQDTVSLATNGGDIRVDELDVGQSIALDVKNGNIEGSLAGQLADYRLTTQIKKGHTNLPESTQNGTTNLEVAANNGDISLEFAN